MDASPVSSERVPWTVRLNTYLAPQRVPMEWREWAVREIRSPGWAWKSIGMMAACYLPFLLVVVSRGSGFGWVLASLMVGMTIAVGWPTRNFRRRQALAMLRGKREQDVRLRPWDLPLALGIGAVAVALLLLYGP